MQGLHRDFACLIYQHLIHKPSQKRIYEIIQDAVAIEKVYFLFLNILSNLIFRNI